MKKAQQPDWKPTRKWMGIPVAGVASEIWGRAMAELFPVVAGHETSLLAGVLISAAIFYVVPDAPNEAAE